MAFWCQRCELPLLRDFCERCKRKGNELTTRGLRPVFREEVSFIHALIGEEILAEMGDLTLWASHRDYYANGRRLLRIVGSTPGSLKIQWCGRQRPLFIPLEKRALPQILKDLEQANRSALAMLEYRALEFIGQSLSAYPDRLPIVSFSGGKDSTIVSHLVRKALGTAQVFHVFGDTTLEFPTTYEYIGQFQAEHPKIPFFIPRPDLDFYELSRQLGPPSRIKRWCCTIFKTAPLSTVLNTVNEEQGVLSFDGIRRVESNQRKDYLAITPKNKISRQVLASPLLRWEDTEVWLYLLTQGLSFNHAYRLGFNRVGCLPCPFNSDWSEVLSSHFYPTEYRQWQDCLREYGERCGKRNLEEYATSGAWKARAGGRGLENQGASLKKFSCDREECTYTYELQRPFDEAFWEYLKPFGRLVKIYDDGIVVRACIQDGSTNEPLVMLKGTRHRDQLRLSLLASGNRHLLLQRLERQIKKYQCCVGCHGCYSVCPKGAISLNGCYRIDESRCIQCLSCVSSLKGGCVAANSLRSS